MGEIRSEYRVRDYQLAQATKKIFGKYVSIKSPYTNILLELRKYYQKRGAEMASREVTQVKMVG